MKPYSLNKNDKIAIISLSGGSLGEAYNKPIVELGIKRLKDLGFVTVFTPNSLKGIDFLHNNPKARAEDLKAAFRDDSIKAILCAIGGDDTILTIPYLLSDSEFILNVKKHPKVFFGYSDSTINHLMFCKLGLQTYYGISFITDFCELASNMIPYTLNSFVNFCNNPKAFSITPSKYWYRERDDYSIKNLGFERIAVEEERGYIFFNSMKKVKGELFGGCIEILSACLGIIDKDWFYHKEIVDIFYKIADKFKLFPTKDYLKGKILFLESSEVFIKPEKLKQFLLKLEELGILAVLNGIIVSKPMEEKYFDEYLSVYKDVCSKYSFPVIYNFNLGHSCPRNILPYGVKCEIDPVNKTIRIVEKMTCDN